MVILPAEADNVCISRGRGPVANGEVQFVVWVGYACPGAEGFVGELGVDFDGLVDVPRCEGCLFACRQGRVEGYVPEDVEGDGGYGAEGVEVLAVAGGDFDLGACVADVLDGRVEGVGKAGCGEGFLEEVHGEAGLAALEFPGDEHVEPALVAVAAHGPPVHHFVETGRFESAATG